MKRVAEYRHKRRIHCKRDDLRQRRSEHTAHYSVQAIVADDSDTCPRADTCQKGKDESATADQDFGF